MDLKVYLDPALRARSASAPNNPTGHEEGQLQSISFRSEAIEHMLILVKQPGNSGSWAQLRDSKLVHPQVASHTKSDCGLWSSNREPARRIAGRHCHVFYSTTGCGDGGVHPSFRATLPQRWPLSPKRSMRNPKPAMASNPEASKYPNVRASGPKYCSLNGIWYVEP